MYETLKPVLEKRPNILVDIVNRILCSHNEEDQFPMENVTHPNTPSCKLLSLAEDEGSSMILANENKRMMRGQYIP